MNLDDLRYSNTLYTFRAIWENPKTVDEIASELKMTPLTVSKIINKLYSDKLVDKYKKTNEKRCGRPNDYYAPGSYYYSVLMLCENGVLYVYYISPNGLVTPQTGLTTKLIKGDETIIANEIRGLIGSKNPRSLGIYLLSDDQTCFGEVKFVTKCDINELFAEAYRDEEKVIFIEHDNAKILINHAKPRIVDISVSELKSILDIDEYCDYRGESLKDLAIDGMKKLTLKLLEKKI